MQRRCRGLLGGLVLFLIMAGYNAAMSWDSGRSSTRVSPRSHSKAPDGADGGDPRAGDDDGRADIVASHLIVGGLLHLVMSAGAGTAFVVAGYIY
jgi:hypothetical protein